MSVELIDHMGSDESVARAAWVSTQRDRRTATPENVAGLIRFLLSNRPTHACFDSDTEVLTNHGWQLWSEIEGQELFVTRSPGGRIEYQAAQRVVHAQYEGDMVSVQLHHVDALVTPNHRIYAEQRVKGGYLPAGTVEVTELSKRCYRLQLGGGNWSGHDGSPEWGRLLGFFIGDGSWSGDSGPKFHLRRERKIVFLRKIVAEAGFGLNEGSDGHFNLNGGNPALRQLLRLCYDGQRDKRIPRDVLLSWSREALEGVYQGLLESDGHVAESGKETYSTTSYALAGDIQELMLKIGRAATVSPWSKSEDSPHGYPNAKPVWRVALYQDRNMRPRVGQTTEERKRQISLQPYDGMVHCVTVPNGTLYVRRNGKPRWCGNSPFGHPHITFLVECPIFVAREWMRHRTQTFSEVSSRYSDMSGETYLPPLEDFRTQVGKPGAYHMEAMPHGRAALAQVCMTAAYDAAIYAYRDLLDQGVAREVARNVLPVGTMTRFYATASLRNWLGFLILRDDPMALLEIRREAEVVKRLLIDLFPVTMDTWVEEGRPPV